MTRSKTRRSQPSSHSKNSTGKYENSDPKDNELISKTNKENEKPNLKLNLNTLKTGQPKNSKMSFNHVKRNNFTLSDSKDAEPISKTKDNAKPNPKLYSNSIWGWIGIPSIVGPTWSITHKKFNDQVEALFDSEDDEPIPNPENFQGC